MSSRTAGRSVTVETKRRGIALALAALAIVLHLAPASAAPVDAFVGTWDTYTSIQPFPHFALTIAKTGPAQVHGIYQPQPTDPLGQIDGNVIGNVLHYTWSLGAVGGTGTFTVTGKNLSGTWVSNPPTPGAGTWVGTRSSTGGVSVSSNGITITLPGGAAITIPLSGSSGGIAPTPPPPAPSTAPPSGSLSAAQIATDANVHSGPSKGSPVVATLGGGSTVDYDPACPGGYCLVYWQDGSGATRSGYVWQNLLGLGSSASSSSPPPTPSGAVDFSGSWNLVINQSGQPPQNYIMQVTQSGASASATLNSAPPSTIACTISGAEMACTWNTGGTDLTGDLTLSGDQLSGAWSVAGSPSSGGSWSGTRM